MSLVNTLVKHGGQQASSPMIFLAYSVAFDAVYPTGGEAFDAQALLAARGYGAAPQTDAADATPTILAVLVEPTGGYMFEYDRAAAKLKVLQGDYDPAAAGPFVEVPAATDLSGLTAVKVLIIAA